MLDGNLSRSPSKSKGIFPSSLPKTQVSNYFSLFATLQALSNIEVVDDAKCG